MASDQNTSVNWFDEGGSSYAQFRPSYPVELSKFLASVCESHAKAVDVGCGNGQLTLQLASYFSSVIGIDPSADQIANAKPANNIKYLVSPAEKLPEECLGADLITAAQAAHWFHLSEFYTEVQKIGKPGSILALISYGVLNLPPPLNDRFQDFYGNEIGPLWPAERKLVDNAYQDLDFPFQEIQAPKMAIELEWDLAQFLGYVSTWSAVKAMRKQQQESILLLFGKEISLLWGSPKDRRKISWPINMRIGTLNGNH